jgi:hypothetical protein
MQVVYGVGALCRIALARKGHFRALGKGVGIGQKGVEIGVVPVTAFGFDGSLLDSGLPYSFLELRVEAF